MTGERDDTPAPNGLRNDVQAALRLRHLDDTDDSPFRDLLIYRVARQRGRGTHQATRDVIDEALHALAATSPDHASVLQGRFLDRTKAQAVASRLNVAESTVYKLQKEAIDRLAETVSALEKQAHAALESKVADRLDPPSYAELVGIDGHLEALSETLVAPASPWLLSIEGIGGIGKTSLADALMRRMVKASPFIDFGWVSARQQTFAGGGIRPVPGPALTAEALIDRLTAQLLLDLPPAGSLSPDNQLRALSDCLKQAPHLVVIDNLESLLDLEALLPLLHRLAGPSKFVLTSRQSLFFEPGLRHFIVPELSEPDALRLIRFEAELRGLAELAAAGDDDLHRIYERVGGNPLTLRLVVGQTHMASLDTVIDDLTSAHGTAEDLYTFIYRRAWEGLDAQARQVLIALPLATSHGGTRDDLAAITELEPGQVHRALEQLVGLNLVDSRGGLHEHRYTIHNLTRTFLMEQVVRW